MKNLILTIAGSYRRCKEVSNDIDILITHSEIKTNKEYSKIDLNYLYETIKYRCNIVVDIFLSLFLHYLTSCL